MTSINLSNLSLSCIIELLDKEDEHWGECSFCGSNERIEHATECLQHKADCNLKIAFHNAKTEFYKVV